MSPDAVFSLRELKSLEDLSLSGMDTTDTHLALLSELTNLKRLWVGANPRSPVSDEGLRYLSRLKHLEMLAIGGNRITAHPPK